WRSFFTFFTFFTRCTRRPSGSPIALGARRPGRTGRSRRTRRAGLPGKLLGDLFDFLFLLAVQTAGSSVGASSKCGHQSHDGDHEPGRTELLMDPRYQFNPPLDVWASAEASVAGMRASRHRIASFIDLRIPRDPARMAESEFLASAPNFPQAP